MFLIQLGVVMGLVHLDRVLPLGGMLHALVGVIFILLPMLVLDRRDRPYQRYGIAWGNTPKDIVSAVAAMAVLFPLVVGATHLGFLVLGPGMWGLKTVPPWQFAWPAGYPTVAISHLIVVALPEEVFYRGYLMGRLDDIFTGRIRILGTKVGWSLPIQALLFGVGHVLVDFNPERFMVSFSALAFGWLRANRGTILAPVLLHAASNIFMEVFRAGYGLG